VHNVWINDRAMALAVCSSFIDLVVDCSQAGVLFVSSLVKFVISLDRS